MNKRIINSIIFLFFTVSFMPVLTCAQENDTTIYLISDTYPEFKYQNCKSSFEACERYFRLNYKMPSALTDNGYQGTVVVQFVVEKDGRLSNIEILRGMNDSLDLSILEFVKKMPKWNPVLKKGKTVRSVGLIPIKIAWLYGNNE